MFAIRHLITDSNTHCCSAKFAIKSPDSTCNWYGVGGQTVAKVLKCDLGVVRDFGPDVVHVWLC